MSLTLNYDKIEIELQDAVCELRRQVTGASIHRFANVLQKINSILEMNTYNKEQFSKAIKILSKSNADLLISISDAINDNTVTKEEATLILASTNNMIKVCEAVAHLCEAIISSK